MREGAIVATGWSNIPAPLNAAALARGGFKCVCVDMQHGLHDEASMIASMQAVHQAGALPGVRIPVGRYELASKALDAGGQIIIAPMINTVADAEALVAASKYPPIGGRSWGPALALDLWGSQMGDYLAAANELCLTIAMIETVEARENLQAILDVPGIDGVFVGPSDLSITLSQGARIEATAPHVLDVAVDIGAQARAAGKIAGVYAFDAEKARAFVAKGFTFAAVGSDLAAMKSMAASSFDIG
jgi:4-hydroxy-2-oxoheptanedioate aldolase